MPLSRRFGQGGSRDNAAGGRHGSKMCKIVVVGPFSAVLPSQANNTYREGSCSNSTPENFSLQPSRNFEKSAIQMSELCSNTSARELR